MDGLTQTHVGGVEEAGRAESIFLKNLERGRRLGCCGRKLGRYQEQEPETCKERFPKDARDSVLVC